MIPGRREWDEQVLRTCLYQHDIEVIKRIRLSNRIEDDFIAWHYEKLGMFSVRNAYKLALQQEHELANRAGSSSRPDGN
jgi:hypothetical protein